MRLCNAYFLFFGVSRNTIANYFKKIGTKLRYQMTFQSESSQP